MRGHRNFIWVCGAALAAAALIFGVCAHRRTPFVIRVTARQVGAVSVAVPETRPERTVRVYLPDSGQIVPMDLETYVLGALAGEMPAAYEPDALRAQATAARTYALYRKNNGGCTAHPGADVCGDAGHCQAFLGAQQRAESWGGGAAEYEEKLRRAVADTENRVITYEGAPVLALFHANSGGQTADSLEVFSLQLPYLKSVAGYDAGARTQAVFSARQLGDLLGSEETPVVESVSVSGRVQQVCAGDKTYTGAQLRALLGLPSACFAVHASGGQVVFDCQGYGHGVGMSQQGAQALAQEGWRWTEILAHYYTGTRVETLTDSLWSGERK